MPTNPSGQGSEAMPTASALGEVSLAPSTGPPQRVYATGMTVALCGMLMFFMALVSAYVVRKGFPNSDWRSLNVPRILWLNTVILLTSSVTLEFSRHRRATGDEDSFRHWWGVTTILGVFFLAGQAIAWRQLAVAGVFLATNPSSSFFYVFTGAHALHLLDGIGGLIAITLRDPGRLTRATSVEVAAGYWHFMDGLWAFLFLLLVLGR
jgi:cytochrome c oxidase subunit 3